MHLTANRSFKFRTGVLQHSCSLPSACGIGCLDVVEMLQKYVIEMDEK